MILLAAISEKKSWYPSLKRLAIDHPLILPFREDLLSQGPILHQNPGFLRLTKIIRELHQVILSS
ncbi:hypothetical protein GDO81_001168 [Engystomops pustulosus]|uniref:Uncharacterized protein n=1 Tax=Engystomops pustulosus TaxID=76066 RepID=A0AAV7DCL5_ENGPU|nr:hypothetical protein GDO81_001168 [Engystomops pustulosus]